jgi:cholesterol 7alpha-monooxygenase
MDNPKLAKSASLRPWDGGHTLCIERSFARRSVDAFLAVLMARYNLEVGGGRFLELDRARPSQGMASVKRGMHVKMKFTLRE